MTSTDTETTTDPTGVDPPAAGALSVGPGRRGRGLLAAGIFGLALALVGAGLALSRNGEEVAVTAGENRPLDPGSSAIAAATSPVLVVNPADSNHVVAAARLDRPRFGIILQVSRDGGRSWTPGGLSIPPGEDRPYTPDLAFDAKGNLYALFTTLTGPTNTPGGVWLERSSDGGDTFSPPVKVTGPNAFQARVAVQPDGSAVHVTWVQSRAEVADIADGFPPPPNPLVMATSRDGGATFAEPVQVARPNRQRVGAATPVPAPAGGVYVLFQDFGDDSTDFENQPGPVHSGRFNLVLAHSEDGRSFGEEHVVDAEIVPTERFLPYLPKHPSIAVDPEEGDLYVAWSDGRTGDPDVFIRRSADGGETWSDAIQVNDDSTSSAQYLPAVTVGDEGRVHVLYLDRRDDPDDVLTVASLATSFDEGRTWVTVAASDAAFDSRAAQGSEGSSPGAGSWLGLVAAGNVVHAAWSDTRRGDLDTGKQDVYMTTIRFART